MKSFGINWDFIKKFLGIKSEDVPPTGITRAQLAKELEPGLNALFGTEYDPYPRTRQEQILHSMNHAGSGTSRQLSRRLGLSLSVTRTHLTALHKKGLIRDSGADVGTGVRTQNIWEVVD
tara:strand:+ start:929 stop:1288 length:360 start_codon:yes stop_codon:yes gene_type:complete